MQPLTTIPFKIWVNNFSKHLPLPAYENNLAEFPLLYYLQYIFKLKIYTNETFAKEICKDFVGANVAPQLVKTKKSHGFFLDVDNAQLAVFWCFNGCFLFTHCNIYNILLNTWMSRIAIGSPCLYSTSEKSHRLRVFFLFIIVSFILMRRNWSFSPACM